MSIEIIVGFDGSCPHSRQAVKQAGRHKFIIFPSFRSTKERMDEEQRGKGSRFSIKVANRGQQVLPVELIADWETNDRTENHDIGHIKHESDDDWTMISGRREPTKITYRLTVKPGITHVALYPEYNTADCGNWVETLPQYGVRTIVAGYSRQDRKIWLLRLPSPNPKAWPFMVQTRDHAYETAGSYVAEGIVNFLVSGEPMADYLRGKFDFTILPMTNPDGVYKGLSRLTWEQGADMNRVHTVPDRGHATVKRVIDKCKPRVYMNVHNWTYKYYDGLYCNDGIIAERIVAHMPADSAHNKRWNIQTSADFLKQMGLPECPEKNKSWKNYCRDKFGAWGVTFEFPWFGLNTADMREKGKKAMLALAHAVIETSRL